MIEKCSRENFDESLAIHQIRQTFSLSNFMLYGIHNIILYAIHRTCVTMYCLHILESHQSEHVKLAVIIECRG